MSNGMPPTSSRATRSTTHCLITGGMTFSPLSLTGGNTMNTSKTLAAAVAMLLTSACSGGPKSATKADIAAIEAAAHGGYVDAINTNDAEKLRAILTDDVVYQAPGAPEIVGKAAVGEWVAGYFAAYQTKWEKTSLGFTVSGDWAFERYTYKAIDTDRKTGAVLTDVGKGINIFRKGADGQWRVAVDGWSSDKPAS